MKTKTKKTTTKKTTKQKQNTTVDTPLTPSEKVFIQTLVWEHEKCQGKLYKAFMVAYPRSKEITAKNQASVVMNKPNVQAAYEKECMKRQEELDRTRAKREEIAQNELKDQFHTLLNTSVADLYDDDGRARPLSELGAKAQIIDQVRRRPDGQGGYDVEYILMPKEKILDMLCKRFGLYKPEEAKVQINMPVVEVAAKIDIENWNENANGNK